MRVVSLKIQGFRGIKEGEFTFEKENVLIGESNAGKSTIIEALSLVLGRDRMHYRQLTEHDFYGSDPKPNDRIHIIATIAGFPQNSPNYNITGFVISVLLKSGGLKNAFIQMLIIAQAVQNYVHK